MTSSSARAVEGRPDQLVEVGVRDRALADVHDRPAAVELGPQGGSGSLDGTSCAVGPKNIRFAGASLRGYSNSWTVNCASRSSRSSRSTKNCPFSVAGADIAQHCVCLPVRRRKDHLGGQGGEQAVADVADRSPHGRHTETEGRAVPAGQPQRENSAHHQERAFASGPTVESRRAKECRVVQDGVGGFSAERDAQRAELGRCRIKEDLLDAVVQRGDPRVAFVARAPVQAVGFGRQFQKLHTRRLHLRFKGRTGQEPHPPTAGQQPGRDGEHRPHVSLGRHAAQNRRRHRGLLAAAAAVLTQRCITWPRRVESFRFGGPFVHCQCSRHRNTTDTPETVAALRCRSPVCRQLPETQRRSRDASVTGSNVRLQAIRDVEAYVPPAASFDVGEAPGEIFGANVFSKSVMQKRLPKSVFKSVIATIENAAPLDPAVADAVASAMKDWAMEKGATHYAHVFYPLTGLTAEKHDSFLEPGRRGFGARRVRREDAGPGRAGRLQLPQRRPAQHVRGPRLHRLGRDQPGVRAGEPERQHPLHPDGFRVDDR